MSETDAGAGEARDAEAAQVALPIQVNAQYVKDLSFENPNAPHSLTQLSGSPEVAVNVDVRAQPLSETAFEVELVISAKAEANNTLVFLVELTYAGVFTLARGLSQDLVRGLLLVEAPRLLFPFARAIAAEATRNGGFPPLLINPVDFMELYRRRYRDQTGAEAARSGPDGDHADSVGEPAGNA